MRDIVTLHQPNYLPWIGFFSKVSQAECLVVMDSVQYIRRGVTHRNKIKTNYGAQYLTIPISKEFSYARIRDIRLPLDKSWQKAHWQSIIHSYGRAKYFDDYREFFESLYYSHEFEYLWEFNMHIILYLFKCFGIEVEIIFASELDLDPNLKKTDLIVAILKAVEAKSYLSGPSGRGYLEQEKFRENGIELKFARFTHPVYQQRFGIFEPNLSAIDLLFNEGPRSGALIRGAGSSESAEISAEEDISVLELQLPDRPEGS
ncbi:MAG: WbqC family protein [Dehalococcoidales bacterium]|jgi:hypothetical protein|nr:WbqC family protein [Dehalococcoidales bacterium]